MEGMLISADAFFVLLTLILISGKQMILSA
jgi:hypothetical protein